MRGIITLVGIGLITTGVARGQGTAPPARARPTTPAVASPASGASAPAQVQRRQRIYVPRKMKGRPVASGLDGLDVPIDRKTYAGTPAQRAATNLAGGVAADPGSASMPPGAPTSGSRYLITSGAISANNELGGPGGQSVYTFTNDQGGTSAILYDQGSGGATRYDYIGSVGHVYYGDLPPGVQRIQPQVPTVTFGNGSNSLSGPGASFSADSVGPFGAPHFPTPPMPAINPVSPSYTGTVYGISPGLQAPSLGGTPFSPGGP